jgi:hypothetical protein
MTFTIRALKDGDIFETVHIGPTATVAKARGLFKTGWMVHIIDSDGSSYAPSEFDQLLAFDRHAAKEPPKRRRSEFAGKYLGRASRAGVKAGDGRAGRDHFFISCIRARVDALGITRIELDHLSGNQEGFSGKLLGAKQVKKFGKNSLGQTVGATGTYLLLVEDPEETAKIMARCKLRQRPLRPATRLLTGPAGSTNASS